MDIKSKCRVAPFPINGQGIFIYTDKNKEHFSIYATPEDLKPGKECYKLDEYIVLHVNQTNAQFAMKMKSDEEETVLCENYEKAIGTEVGEMTSYWFSYDRDQLVLKYGKGHVMEETTRMTHPFLKGKTAEEQIQIRKQLLNIECFSMLKQRKVFW